MTSSVMLKYTAKLDRLRWLFPTVSQKYHEGKTQDIFVITLLKLDHV